MTLAYSHHPRQQGQGNLSPWQIWQAFSIVTRILTVKLLSSECRRSWQNLTKMNATKPHWWEVNIYSGNGLVLSGVKPLPDPMLTQFCATKRQAWEQLDKKLPEWGGTFDNAYKFFKMITGILPHAKYLKSFKNLNIVIPAYGVTRVNELIHYAKTKWLSFCRQHF